MPDKRTIAVYDTNASEYVRCLAAPETYPKLESFIDAMPPGGHVLDLGCGPGTWAGRMMERGLKVDALDASEGMAALAWERFGLKVRIGTFDAVTGSAVYDGIWAHYSLLHAPREAMPGHLAALRRALKPSGRMLIALKLGDGARRDKLGRFYTYYSAPELNDLLAEARFDVIERATGQDVGFDGSAHDWIAVTVHPR